MPSNPSAAGRCSLDTIPATTRRSKLLTKLGFTHTHDEFYPPTGLMHPSYRLVRAGRAIPDVA